MRSAALLSLVWAAAVWAQDAPTTGELGDATVVTDNPFGAVYVAELPDTPFSPIDVEGNVKGKIIALSAPDKKGVLFEVVFSNLPKEGGPFLYHIHVDPVPEDGNCTKTLAHLDPFIRGESPPCDANNPATCQVGDLSGKYGKVQANGSEPFVASFTDPYVSLEDGLGSFFGNRSFVLHYANKTRITCANFEMVAKPKSHNDDCNSSAPEGSGGSGTGSQSPTGNGTLSPPPPASTSTSPSTGSGAVTANAVVQGASLLGALAAFMFAL